MNIEQLRARFTEIRDLLLVLAERDAPLEGDDAQSWADLNAEFDTVRAQIAEHEAREARVAEIRTAALNPAQVERGSFQVMQPVDTRHVDIRSLTPGERVDVARKTVEEWRGLKPEQQERVESLIGGDTGDLDSDTDSDLSSRAVQLVLRTGRREYRTAYQKIMRDPIMGLHGLSEDERQAVTEARAMSTTDSAGGYAIPFGLDPTFIQIGAGATNPFRQISRTITTGAIDKWRGVTVTQVDASYDAEAAEVSDDTPTLAQPEIDLYKAAVFIPISYEALGDLAGIEGQVSMLIDDAKNRLEASQFATGSGSSQPWGVINALSPDATALVTASTRSVYAIGDLFAVNEAIPARYENNTLSWVSHKAILNDTRQFGTANNYYGFTVDLTAGGVPSVLGSQWYTASGVTSTITTGNHVLVYGDFNYFFLVDRLGMTMSYIPHLFSTGNGRPTGQAGWYAYWRHGSDVVENQAFRLLKL